LRDIRLEAGETVIIAPATGGFGGAAVLVALAMGAKVIAMGRNAEALAKLKTLSGRIETVQITRNQEEEVAALQKFGPADAFFDISPRRFSRSVMLGRYHSWEDYWRMYPFLIEFSCVKTSNFMENGCTVATTLDCL
jgi:D-arabinose 1-dehydrogenase-like Zn-dependent alcohol dehydrogenase